MATRVLDGTTFTGPLKVKTLLPSSRDEVVGRAFRDNTRARVHWFEDFDGALPTYTLHVPLTTDGGVHEQATTGDNTGYVYVPRSGFLVSAQVTAEDALAANDTNYLTFTVTNTLASGSGTTAMLAATDANTTKSTGGTAITAVVGRSLTVHGTAANLRVNAGDVIKVTEAVTGTLANAVDKPIVRLTFATVPAAVYPHTTYTAGSPLVGPVEDSANGEAVCQLSATNEVNNAFLTWNDQLLIPANRRPVFEARVKMGTVTTAQVVVIGLASAFNATLDSTTSNVWFRWQASLAALAEGDDGTTDTDDAATGKTLTTGTYYYFKIDMSDLKDVKFWIDDDLVYDGLDVSALDGNDLLQPIIGIQKASGTGTVSVTCDWAAVSHDRY